MSRKVIHIITGLNTGGAERALYNILQGGLAVRYRSVVISLADEGRYGPMLKKLGVEVFSLNMKRGIPSISALLKLRSILKKHHPAFIQGWMYHGNLIASLASLLLVKRVPVVWNVRHCLYDLSAEKRLTQWVIKLCIRLSQKTAIITYNSLLSRTQHEHLGFNSAIGLVIPNGFPLKRFEFSEKFRDNIRPSLKVSDKAIVVGHVGRYHPMKDHETFLRAAVEVAQHISCVVFLLLGTDVEYSNPALAALIPIGLRSRFLLIGEISDVEKYYSAMDVFCLSSSSEAFPNVLGEAMACGLPCVTTDVGDASYIVGETGIVVPPENPTALAAAVFEILDKTEYELAELKRTARERIKENFSLTSVVKCYASLYEDIQIDSN
jgi:glycosyltransferase involved in cell wall biosynthesis